jgi:hypothetical protein
MDIPNSDKIAALAQSFLRALSGMDGMGIFPRPTHDFSVIAGRLNRENSVGPQVMT